MRPRELDLPALLSMLEEVVAAKFRLERTAVELLQAEEMPGAASPVLDERAHMSLHNFFYEHLRKKYTHPAALNRTDSPSTCDAIPQPELFGFRTHWLGGRR
jgi:hypothetical protein